MASRSTPNRLARGVGTVARRFVAGTRQRTRIDTRSLAAFRIALGLLIVADILLRSRNRTLFYTDEGVVPIELAIAAEPVAAYSPYAFVGSPGGVALLFGLTALVGVALAVGYYTRPVTVVALVLVVSLDARNPFVLSFADVLFATLLAFAVFLPLGERWSVDAVASDRPRRTSVASVASALVLTQLVVMYVVNGYHKTTSELWRSGEAAVLVLGIDEITFLFGDALRAAPELLQLGGFVWLVMLCLAWLLLVLRDRPRHLFVAAFVIAHLSMAFTVRIGAFSYVCLAGLTLFLAPSAWDDGHRLLDRIGRRTAAWGVPVARIGTGLDDGRRRAVATARPLPRPRLPRPGLLARLPFDPPVVSTRRNAFFGAVIVAGVVLGVAASLSAVGVVDEGTPQAEVEAGANALVEFQTDWSIFAPHPRTVDRYYVFPAVTTDGEVIDVHGDRPMTYDRPYDELQRQHDTYRERFYMASLPGDEGVPVADHLAAHLCATYEFDDGGQLTHVNMYLVEERITRETIDDPTGRERSEHLLSRHACTEGESPRDIAPPGNG